MSPAGTPVGVENSSGFSPSPRPNCAGRVLDRSNHLSASMHSTGTPVDGRAQLSASPLQGVPSNHTVPAKAGAEGRVGTRERSETPLPASPVHEDELTLEDILAFSA